MQFIIILNLATVIISTEILDNGLQHALVYKDNQFCLDLDLSIYDYY